MSKVAIIVARGKNGEIGRDNQLIWRLPADLAYFRRLTTGNCLVMGRNTFQSIGTALPGRKTIVLSRSESFKKSLDDMENCYYASSLDEALDICRKLDFGDTVFIAGGAQVYKQVLEQNIADEMYITQVDASLDADAFFYVPNRKQWKRLSCEHHGRDKKNTCDYTFEHFIKL